MTQDYREALAELNTIIQYMNKNYKNKIPQAFIDFITQNMDVNYKPNISKDIPINEQNLKKDTKILLSLLYRNYWCNNELKTQLMNEDLKSKKEYEQRRIEKYNPKDLFENEK